MMASTSLWPVPSFCLDLSPSPRISSDDRSRVSREASPVQVDRITTLNSNVYCGWENEVGSKLRSLGVACDCPYRARLAPATASAAVREVGSSAIRPQTAVAYVRHRCHRVVRSSCRATGRRLRVCMSILDLRLCACPREEEGRDDMIACCVLQTCCRQPA